MQLEGAQYEDVRVTCPLGVTLHGSEFDLMPKRADRSDGDKFFLVSGIHTVVYKALNRNLGQLKVMKINEAKCRDQGIHSIALKSLS